MCLVGSVISGFALFERCVWCTVGMLLGLACPSNMSNTWKSCGWELLSERAANVEMLLIVGLACPSNTSNTWKTCGWELVSLKSMWGS